MNSIDQYIFELLHDHDCVIVPSLGGFLASGIHASINPIQHTISPPVRKIAFNVYLRHNDGLLASQLSDFEHIAYADALRRIEEYATGCHRQLDKGRKVTIEQVGILAYDKERNLQFEPFRHINYLKDVFGMGPVRLIPVNPEPLNPVTSGTRREFTALRPSEKNPHKTKDIRKVNQKTYLGMIAVAGALVWFSINLYLVSSNHAGVGSLNPFEKNIPSIIEKDSSASANKLNPVIENKPITPETVYVSNASPEKEASTVQTEIPESVVESSEKPLSPVPQPASAFTPGVYYVIGGVFRIQGNAQSFVHTLHDHGFQEAGIIQSGNLNYVCFNNFSTRKDALSLLDSLNKVQYSAWVLHH